VISNGLTCEHLTPAAPRPHPRAAIKSSVIKAGAFAGIDTIWPIRSIRKQTTFETEAHLDFLALSPRMAQRHVAGVIETEQAAEQPV
jgi:hypothetical protein